MTDESNKEDPVEAGLENLLRSVLRDISSEIEIPSQDDILAYLAGRATERQKARMQDALASSSEFQRFMLDLNHAIVMSADTDAAVNASHLELPADFQQRIAAEFERKPSPIAGIQVRLRESLSALADLLRPRILVPAAVVPVAIAAILIMRVSDQLPTMSAYDQLLSSYFLDGAIRGEPDELATQPDELAYQEFAKRIRLDNETGEFEVLPETATSPISVGKRVVARMLDANGNERAKFAAQVPVLANGQAPDSLSLWLLTVPSLEVWQYSMDRDSVDLLWSTDFENEGCGVFTYFISDSFKATDGVAYRVDE